MSFRRLSIYAGLLLLSSCITEYQPERRSIPRSLVVEGVITDQPGPYTIKLTQTTEYTNASINLLASGATVTITDNLGTTETLTERTPGLGVYRTRANGIRGVAGRRYTLTIVTSDGKRYQSNAELLTAAPPIGKLYYEYRAEPNALTGQDSQGWDVYVDTKDPETTGDYYRWEWTHYEPVSVCQVTDRPNAIPFGLGCCTRCWDITRCYTCVNIKSDAAINGNTLSRQLITRVPFTSRSAYYIEVQQQRLSAGGYAFWQSVKSLTQNNGGLFDAAPSTVGGNMRCVSDPGSSVYGYFGASGISESFLYVDRTDARGSAPAPPPVEVSIFGCAPCADDLYRTPNTPRWWRN
ncbi:MAG: DUF4249 domain-containing protein [Bacteroidetes bacterium]|nr:DUF4249 domain-containing protein [Fibrella sp.]